MTPAAPMPTVYLDHAGAAPPAAGLFRRWGELAAALAVNPHGTTRYSAESKRQLHLAENRLLQALAIPDDEARIVWTSGGTEAINLAVHGLLAKGGVDACVVDGAGHAALFESCRQFAAQFLGGCITTVSAPRGRMIPPSGKKGDVCLLAATQVNNETGAIQDLVDLRRVANATWTSTILLVDALQSVGRLPVPWREAGIDLLVLGGRKLGGPAGLGALVVRRGIELAPLMFGGGQQDGLRPGTLDTAAIVALTEVVEARVASMETEGARIARLRETLLAGLAKVRGREVGLLSPADASPYIACLSFPGFEGAVLVRLLAERGVVVGAGSACSAEAKKPSRVLKNMGLDDRLARGALRVSFGPDSSEKDVRRFLAELATVLDAY